MIGFANKNTPREEDAEGERLLYIPSKSGLTFLGYMFNSRCGKGETTCGTKHINSFLFLTSAQRRFLPLSKDPTPQRPLVFYQNSHDYFLNSRYIPTVLMMVLDRPDTPLITHRKKPSGLFPAAKK